MSLAIAPVEIIDFDQSVLFPTICDDLMSKSYSIQQNALPQDLLMQLADRAKNSVALQYIQAGIG